MKKLAFFSLAYITIISCRYNDHNTSITYHDSERYYSMNAHFSKSKTRDVDAYIDKRIGAGSNFSFSHTEVNSTITLNDETKFYMLKVPGHIEIKLVKEENSDESYDRIRSVCEGMKSVLTK